MKKFNNIKFATINLLASLQEYRNLYKDTRLLESKNLVDAASKNIDGILANTMSTINSINTDKVLPITHNELQNFYINHLNEVLDWNTINNKTVKDRLETLGYVDNTVHTVGEVWLTKNYTTLANISEDNRATLLNKGLNPNVDSTNIDRCNSSVKEIQSSIRKFMEYLTGSDTNSGVNNIRTIERVFIQDYVDILGSLKIKVATNTANAPETPKIANFESQRHALNVFVNIANSINNWIDAWKELLQGYNTLSILQNKNSSSIKTTYKISRPEVNEEYIIVNNGILDTNGIVLNAISPLLHLVISLGTNPCADKELFNKAYTLLMSKITPSSDISKTLFKIKK